MVVVRQSKIKLKKIILYGHHGLHDSEQAKGNTFEISVTLTMKKPVYTSGDEITKTIDYEEVYQIVKKCVEKSPRKKLLETMGYKISEQLISVLKNITKAKISVAKINPPLGGVCKKAKITLVSTKA